MKKAYFGPVMKIRSLSVCDIITASDLSHTQFGGGDIVNAEDLFGF